MPLCAFAKNYKLHLRTFYTSDTSLKVDTIPDDSFEPNSYVNSYNGEAVCWVESYIPMSQIFSDDGTIYNFILFNQEPVQCAEIYFLDGQNKWRFDGKIGEGLPSEKRIRPFCYNSIDIHEETLKNIWSDFVRVRMKIISYRSTLIEPFLVSSKYLAGRNIFQLSFFSFHELGGIHYGTVQDAQQYRRFLDSAEISIDLFRYLVNGLFQFLIRNERSECLVK